MQDDSGLKKLLTNSSIYTHFQNLVGTEKARRWIAANLWHLKGGERMVDVGCGPGVILNHVPDDVMYWGFDVSEPYIDMAQKKYGDRGKFLAGTAGDFIKAYDDLSGTIDLVHCYGLLHHLSDEDAIEILEVARKLLAPHGRMVCIESAFLVRHARLAHWVISRDRGRNVRQEQEWKDLIGRVFDTFSTQIVTGLINIPYTHILVECRKELSETP